jgi:hypothetical protein
MNRPILIA